MWKNTDYAAYGDNYNCKLATSHGWFIFDFMHLYTIYSKASQLMKICPYTAVSEVPAKIEVKCCA